MKAIQRSRMTLPFMAMTVALYTASLAAAPPEVRWRSSAQNNYWKDNGTLEVKNDAPAANVITVDTGAKQQVIDGFGGAFNELGWIALQKVAEPVRDAAIKELFDTVTGCNFTICRMPIGASDYAHDYYSLNDNPNDYSMSKFSIQRDRDNLLPYIKAAMKVNPNLRVWGSPWTPPAWMKTNNNYAGGSIRWNDQTLKAYVLYFEKAIEAYRAEGLNFFALFFQNEPYANQVFPSCLWNGTQIRDFIKNYLGLIFEKDSVKCEIWSPTMNQGDFSEFEPMLSDPASAKHIVGCGFQWAGEGAVKQVHERYPNLKIWQTEVRCGDGKNTWVYAQETVFKDMVFYFANGCNNFMQWNMVLKKNGMSTWGWSQNSPLVVDTVAKTVAYTPQLYAAKHFSAYVKTGARKLRASATGLDPAQDFTVFLNPSGQVVVVFKNSAAAAKDIAIKWGTSMVTAHVPENTFNTITITPQVQIGGTTPSIASRPGFPVVTRKGSTLAITTRGDGCRLKVVALDGTLVRDMGRRAGGVTSIPCAGLSGVFLIVAEKDGLRYVKKIEIP